MTEKTTPFSIWKNVCLGMLIAVGSLFLTTPSASANCENQNQVEDKEESVCTVAINSPFVALNKEPRRFSQQLLRLPPGRYNPTGYRVTSFAGRDEGWFQITHQGKSGWVQDSIYEIETKSANCR